MTFNCTLVGGPGSPTVHPPVELSIDAPSGMAGTAIHQQLVREFGTGTVTVHMRRLREKIEADAAHPRFLETVWGVGYRFSP